VHVRKIQLYKNILKCVLASISKWTFIAFSYIRIIVKRQVYKGINFVADMFVIFLDGRLAFKNISAQISMRCT
jgi:hypothetical protein